MNLALSKLTAFLRHCLRRFLNLISLSFQIKELLTTLQTSVTLIWCGRLKTIIIVCGRLVRTDEMIEIKSLKNVSFLITKHSKLVFKYFTIANVWKLSFLRFNLMDRVILQEPQIDKPVRALDHSGRYLTQTLKREHVGLIRGIE